MSLAATTDKYNETQGNGTFNYVLIFIAALIISGLLVLAAIRLFQNNATQSREISPLIRVSPLVRVSPMEVAIAEAATRPFATDPVTPYREELREAVVLDSKTDSIKDSTPVEISKPKPESPVVESHVRKIRTVRRTVHPVSRTVKRHSADNKVLLARVETPVALPVAPKAVQAAPITRTGQEGGAVTEAAALKHMENTSVASIAPSPANTVSSVTNKPAAEMAPAENENSVSYSSSIHSPVVSPYTTNPEVKAVPADTSRDTAAAGVSKEEKAGKEDNKEDKKKGLSAATILDWTIKIVGFALVFLK